MAFKINVTTGELDIDTGLTQTQADALYASLTGYNKSNWDAAYDWGDHADAGYALSSALSDYVPLIGNSSITGNLSVSGNFGIGTNDGLSPLRVVASTDSSYGMASFGNTKTSGVGGGAGLFGYSDDGAAMANGDRLGYLIFAGAKGTDHSLANACAIIGYAIEDWTGSSTRSKLSFETVASGATARAERAYINDTEFNVGSGKFFLDIANTKLGIGTTTPFVSMEILKGTSGAETEVIQLRSGKTAVGSGSSIRWVNSTSKDSTFGAGELAVIRTNAVSSGDSDMIFRVSPAGYLSEYFRIKSDKTFNFIDGGNIVTGTTTGMKIGTAATQKLGFWGLTPVVQQSHIADPSGGDTVDAEARTAINSINALLATLGLTAAS